MSQARFVSAARVEFLDAVAYYDEARPGDGRRFTERVQEAISVALSFPDAGSPSAARTRRVLVRSFPFSVIYRPDAEGIVIFAVAHHARRPRYWQTRLHES